MNEMVQWFTEPGRSNLANWLIPLVALILAGLSLWVSSKGQKRQSELQARIVEIEQAREHERQRLAQRAILRAELIHEPYGRSGTDKLRIYNGGDSEAREIVVKLDGKPIREHPAVVDVGTGINQVGPRSSVQYLVAMTYTTYPPWDLEITWTDDSGEPGLYRTTITA